MSHLSALKIGKNLKSFLQVFWVLSWKKIEHEELTTAKEKRKITKDFVLLGTEK